MFSLRHLGLALVASLALLPSASAHMVMKYPPPRNAAYETDPENGGGRAHPCLSKPAGTPKASVAAGSTLNVEIAGGAPHGGGVCQFSISTDGGNNFVVVKDYFDTCPLSSSYAVPIPSGVPSGTAIFAWSWIPILSGQPEYYMNCADVTITGGGSGFSGPKLLVANLPGYPVVPGKGGNDKFSARPTISVGSGGGGNSNPPPVTPPPANNNPSSCPSSGGSSSSGGDSTPPPPADSGCGAGLCKSKWGFCGTGPAYCGSQEATIDDASEEDAEDVADVAEAHNEEYSRYADLWEGAREWAPHYSDEWLLARKAALEEEMMQLMEEVARRVNYDDKREEDDKKRGEEREHHKKRHARKHHRREH